MRARRVVLTASTLLLLVLAGSAAGSAQNAEEHAQQDAVGSRSESAERALEEKTMTATAADAGSAAAAADGSEGELGSWSAPVDWPVVGVHNALLTDGRVLAYDSVGDRATENYPVHDHTRATVWDPRTGAHQDVRVNTGFNVFCSGLAHLLDGSVFLAGGNKDTRVAGIRQTHTFDSATQSWTLGPDMAHERWYPTVTGLANGEMLITGGRPTVPEVLMSDHGLRQLSSASLSLPLYPWMDVAPDGRVLYSGPDRALRKLDPRGTGSWQSYGERDSIDRSYGGHAMYDIGKVLVAGGGSSSKDARVIDVNGAGPTVVATAPMAFGRRQHNLTVLADGTVLATGGNSSGAALVDLDAGVYRAELWNPTTGAWTTLAAQRVTRQYHSTALLLADGRVLSSGGGICSTCDRVGYLAKNAEVFTPPYLYEKDGSGRLAPRPRITAAPASVDYGAQLRVETPDAVAIAKVGLVRLGAVTHSVDMDQRYVPLSFTAGETTLSATTPVNANVAPPGPYMLFAVDRAGVPSEARMVTLAPGNQPPAVSVTQPAADATFDAPATITLAADASDNDGTVTKVEFFNGTTKLAEDTTAPYAHTWQNVPAGTHSITARATDNDATTTSAPVTITVRPPNQPPAVPISPPADQPPAVPISPPADGRTDAAPPPFAIPTFGSSLLDVVAPTARIAVAGRQRALRRRAVLVRVACPTEACTVAAIGALRLASVRRLRFSAPRRSLAAGRSTILRLTLARRLRAAIRRALRRRPVVHATVRVSATDQAGNRTAQKRTLRIVG